VPEDEDIALSIEELFATVINAQGGSVRLSREDFDKDLAGDMLAVDFDETTEEVVISLAWREEVVLDGD
jgi:hypothetical protein